MPRHKQDAQVIAPDFAKPPRKRLGPPGTYTHKQWLEVILQPAEPEPVPLSEIMRQEQEEKKRLRKQGKERPIYLMNSGTVPPDSASIIRHFGNDVAGAVWASRNTKRHGIYPVGEISEHGQRRLAYKTSDLDELVKLWRQRRSPDWKRRHRSTLEGKTR